MAQRRMKRSVFCLHHPDVEPPAPIENLQTIRAEKEDLYRWITKDLCPILQCKIPPKERLVDSAEKIESLVGRAGPMRENVLKPYIFVEPQWPSGNRPNWNASELPAIDFASASVSVDEKSAIQLGFPTVPRGLALLPFLLRLDCDSELHRSDKPFWIIKLFEALSEAIKGKLLFQEIAYFRHESGRILRPIIVGFAKNFDGTCCKLRIIFVSAFSAPLTDSPTIIHRLTNGVRLGVRTRLEILDPFMNRMAEIQRNKVLNKDPDDVIAHLNPVGSRVVEALNAIMQEAFAHGFRPGEVAPRYFEDIAKQQAYEKLREDAILIRKQLRSVAIDDDRNGSPDYHRSESVLGQLKRINDAYLELAMPRLKELLSIS
jgi:hypothetical protein